MSANPGDCLQIESDNQQLPVAQGVASIQKQAAEEVKNQEAPISKPQAGSGIAGNRSDHAVPPLAPTSSCTIAVCTSRDGLDMFDLEMSGNFTPHFQEHVVAVEVQRSHGTSLVFDVSGWSASDSS